MNLEIPFDILLALGQYINESEIGLAVQGADDRFQFHNRAFAAMVGLETRSLVGLTFDEMLVSMRAHAGGPCPDWPTVRQWLDGERAGGQTRMFRSFEVAAQDGRWVLVTQQYHEHGMLVTLCTDVTEKKQTELALRAARDELERLAMTDELTGVPNRRHFLASMEREYERLNRYGHTACLALFDLDHFKKINDMYGHAAGDTVLKHFAGVLRRHIRGEDVIGRIGGEEFALLLPETTVQGAAKALERMRVELNALTLDDIAPGFAYTFSAGISEMTKNKMPYKEWMTSADVALYQAKTSGRNKVVSHEMVV